MDEPIYIIVKVQFDIALEVWFSIFSFNLKFACKDCFAQGYEHAY